MTLPGTPDTAHGTTSPQAGTERVLGGVAHEIRNALFSMGMTLEALEVSAPNAAELSGFVEALRRQLEPLHAVAADLALLDETSGSGFAPASFATLLRAAAERIGTTGRPDGPRVVILDASVTAARVHVEQASMLRALHHLFTYVLQRSGDGYVVTPVVRDVDDAGESFLECSIEDNGDALSSDDFPHLFEAFFPKSRGGFDLRLTTVRRVIARHGGTIHAEASAVGGVRFVLRLPRVGTAHAASHA